MLFSLPVHLGIYLKYISACFPCGEQVLLFSYLALLQTNFLLAFCQTRVIERIDFCTDSEAENNVIKSFHFNKKNLTSKLGCLYQFSLRRRKTKFNQCSKAFFFETTYVSTQLFNTIKFRMRTFLTNITLKHQQKTLQAL